MFQTCFGNRVFQQPASGSDLIVRTLQAEGVHTVFAIAGDHTLPVMNAMAMELDAYDEAFRLLAEPEESVKILLRS